MRYIGDKNNSEENNVFLKINLILCEKNVINVNRVL